MDDDPFLALQAEVTSASASLEHSFTTWMVSGAGAADYEATRSTLLQQASAIEWDLQELSEAVEATKEEPERFSLSIDEVRRRERFVAAKQRELNRMRDATASAEPGYTAVELGAGNVQGKSEREGLFGAANAEEMERDRESAQRINEAFMNGEREQQEMIVRKQDEDLEELSTAVERIGLLGQEMHNELNEHGEMLDDLEENFDRTRSRMGTVQNKLNKFIEETGRGQFCTIVGLVFLFITLTFLLVTT